MIGNDAPLFGRLVTAMVTPFGDDERIDFKAVDKLVDHLIETGTTAIVVAGTTGESPALDQSEKEELLTAVILRSRGKAKVIMGTGTNVTSHSVKASKRASELGADGLLVVAPYYNKPNQAGLIAHFSAVISATKLPVIIYNIPGRTGINIAVETVVELSKKHSNLHALKDSTGSTDQSAEIAGLANPDLRIYSGDDYLTLPFLSIGGCGIISVASHLVGREITDTMNAFFEGKLDKARQLHYRYLPLFKGLFAQPNPTCVKFALASMGICKPNLRLPLVQLDPQQQEEMRSLMSDLKNAKQYSPA